MRLTAFSDYALRILLYAAASGDRLLRIEDTARIYGISRTHLMKVVNALTRAGYLKGVRGRSGGFALARRPEEIRLGDVVRATEPDFALVECFTEGNRCIVTGCCRLPAVLGEAIGAFNAVLDRYTLADVMLGPEAFPLPVEAADTRAAPAPPPPSRGSSRSP